jgi:hypothetical protein
MPKTGNLTVKCENRKYRYEYEIFMFECCVLIHINTHTYSVTQHRIRLLYYKLRTISCHFEIYISTLKVVIMRPLWKCCNFPLLLALTYILINKGGKCILVPMLNSLSITPWKRIGKRRYICTILDLGTKLRWLASFMPHLLYPPRKITLWVPID